VKISSFQTFSLNEYPGEISAILFTQGCNFNCRYCFNPELKVEEPEEELYIDQNKVLDDLRNKTNTITAVTITGGEPLMQEDIVEFSSEIREMGYKIKINTNGSCYMKLKSIIESGVVDFIRMDVKAPVDKYKDIVCCSVKMEMIKESIKLIKKSGIAHEFHTVMDKDILNDEDIDKIKLWIKDDNNYKVGEKK